MVERRKTPLEMIVMIFRDVFPQLDMFPFVLILACVLCSPLVSSSKDTILPGEFLSENQTLTSKGGVFEMGFFTPGTTDSSRKYYLGIWYKDLPSRVVVWVANRNQPVLDPSLSEYKLLQDGSFVILDSSRNIIWSTNSKMHDTSDYTHGVLLDGGNFVIRGSHDSSDVVAWQSFDHPTDTWLPGAKFGYSKQTNDTTELGAWIRPDDPAPGPYSAFAGCNGKQYLYGLRNGSKIYWDWHEWSTDAFKSDTDAFKSDATLSYIFGFNQVLSNNECYLEYSVSAPFNLTRVVIDSSGQLQSLVWLKSLEIWQLLWNQPAPECEIFAFCGVSSGCNNRSKDVPVCGSQVPLECDRKEETNFFVLPRIRIIPRYAHTFPAESIDLCRTLCLSNCSCAAFAYNEVCYLWTVEKFKVQLLGDDDTLGQDLYIRGSKSLPKENGRKARNIIVLGSSFVGLLFIVVGLMVVVIIRRKKSTREGKFMVDEPLTVFKYQDLKKYTKNFTTKIGEGGFGSVFKGNLSEDSNDIAVKRLNGSNSSDKQFLAEVRSIGSVHHINLVRLRGFCAVGSKRLLIYDYMPGGSLASRLFRKDFGIIDWGARYNIAIGIAEGLAYLHEECRDCIIHCDIKPENVLLDSEMEPKIGDFGLAKLVGRDFSRVLTTVRGTRGYLAPEWISGEAITSKVDVFSYGKLLFEIMSGKRNMDMLSGDMVNYFPIQVSCKIYKGEDLRTLLDYKINNDAQVTQLGRACRVACWCIQDNEKSRPTMSQVVQMLEGVIEVTTPPLPRFFQQLLKH